MSALMIKVKDISQRGMHIERTIDPHEIEFGDRDLHPLSHLEIHALIERANDAVLAKTKVKGKYGFVCARCLEPIERERVDQFQHEFEVSPDTELIDLGEDIRQELVLVCTEIELCSEDCKGLCPNCGVNLNQEACHCGKSADSHQPSVISEKQHGIHLDR